jgi:hypothetical protein
VQGSRAHTLTCAVWLQLAERLDTPSERDVGCISGGYAQAASVLAADMTPEPLCYPLGNTDCLSIKLCHGLCAECASHVKINTAWV